MIVSGFVTSPEDQSRICLLEASPIRIASKSLMSIKVLLSPYSVFEFKVNKANVAERADFFFGLLLGHRLHRHVGIVEVAERLVGRQGQLAVLVDALHRHPGCTALAQQRVLACDSGRQLAERALDILRSNGFGVRQSADLSRAALQTSIMLVSGRPGAETATPQDERAAVLAGKRAALVGLPADRFPHLVECADALTDCDDEAAYYGAGIDLYLAGVTALQQCQAAAAR